MEEATDLMSFVLLGAKFGLATLAAVGPLALFIIAASIGAEYLERKFQEKRDKEDEGMSIAKDMKEFIKELTALCNKRRMRIISSEYYMYLEPFERRVLSIEMQINEHCFVSEEVIEKED